MIYEQILSGPRPVEGLKFLYADADDPGRSNGQRNMFEYLAEPLSYYAVALVMIQTSLDYLKGLGRRIDSA